jgi:hypothetical protein
LVGSEVNRNVAGKFSSYGFSITAGASPGRAHQPDRNFEAEVDEEFGIVDFETQLFPL